MDPKRVLASAVPKLTPKQKQVCKLRYAIGGKYALSLGVIGRKLKLTRERIRQIEAEALEQILAPLDSDGKSAMKIYLADRQKAGMKRLRDAADKALSRVLR
jgi:DNA-directed RNA polymerase sigma subunit (sigma70/sigma32)